MVENIPENFIWDTANISLKEKEKLRKFTFWSDEYKRDHNFKKYFSRMMDQIKSKGYPPWFDEVSRGNEKERIKERIKKCIDSKSIIPLFTKIKTREKEEILEILILDILEIIVEVEQNNYKLNIEFLEKLDRDKKTLIAKLFMKDLWSKLWNNIIMWKSLLIWMAWFFTDNLKNDIYQISRWFESFRGTYFMQAYNFLLPNINPEERTSEQLFSVIAEYNLINNLDKNIVEINNEMTLELWTDFSLWDFRIEWSKKVEYNLDKEWKKMQMNKQEDNYNVSKNEISNQSIPYKKFNIYLDTPASIWLFYRKEPVAIVSFYIQNWIELVINKMQEISYEEYNDNWEYTPISQSEILNSKENRKDILYNAVKKIAQKHWIWNIIYLENV